MSRALLVFNLAVDADDPLLAFALDWLNRLAAYYDRVDVITMRAGRHAGLLAPNIAVWSVGKERGWGEARRAAAFYRVLAARLHERRYTAAFAHMMPLFGAMAGPALLAARVPLTLWYTHRARGRVLAAALLFSRRVVSAVETSFPIPTPKLRAVGHGIDTARYRPADTAGADERPFTVACVARMMPIKRQHVLVQAFAAAFPPGSDARLVLVGGTPDGTSSAYAGQVREMAARLGVADRVALLGAQPAERVVAEYQGADAAVNLSPAGLFDKAALEAMACGVPTLVANPAFAPLLGTDAAASMMEADDDAALAGQVAHGLRRLATMPPAERAALGLRLRERAIAAHSLDALIPRLVSVIETGEPAPPDHRPEAHA